MAYLVLARKYRPGKFADVVGQQHVTTTLVNAMKMDRLAHAFLFSGVRGVGKTSMARILARSLNCESGPTAEPCGTCPSCRAIAEGTSVDVIEIDGASNNSVDDIRELRDTIPYRPVLGRYKIYVIDEVHMLSVSAFNALLKTLEEPPPHVKFVFATTEAHKIPTTILSRVQRYDFRRIPQTAIVDRIRHILQQEGIAAEEAALAIVGREADGSMRDALSILDQVLAAGGDRITAKEVAALLGVVDQDLYFEVCDAIARNDGAACLRAVAAVDRQGYDLPVFLRGLLEHLRNLLVAAICGGEAHVLDVPQETLDRLRTQAQALPLDTWQRAFKHLSEAYDPVARSAFPKILLEAALLRVATLPQLVPATDILQRLEALASGGGAGGGRSGTTPTPQSTAASDSPNGPAISSTAPSAPDPAHRNVAADTPAANTAPPPVEEAPAGPIDCAADRPAAITGPPPTDAPIDDATWQRLCATLAERLPAKGSILERAVLQPESTTSRIRLTMAKEDAFVVESVLRPALGDLEKILAETLGRSVRLEIQLGAIDVGQTRAKQELARDEKRRQTEHRMRNHPLVRSFESTFGVSATSLTLHNPQ